MADPEQTARVFAEVGDLDLVASAAGDVPYERIADMKPEDHLRACRGEVATQVEPGRQRTRHVAERGSSTPGTTVVPKAHSRGPRGGGRPAS